MKSTPEARKQQLIADLAAIRAGRLPDCYAAYDADWRTFNAGLMARYKQATLAETASVTRTSHRALIKALEAFPAEDLGRDFGVRSARGRRITVAMLLTVEARDEQKHAAQIRAFAAQRKE